MLSLKESDHDQLKEHCVLVKSAFCQEDTARKESHLMKAGHLSQVRTYDNPSITTRLQKRWKSNY